MYVKFGVNGASYKTVWSMPDLIFNLNPESITFVGIMMAAMRAVDDNILVHSYFEIYSENTLYNILWF